MIDRLVSEKTRSALSRARDPRSGAVLNDPEKHLKGRRPN